MKSVKKELALKVFNILKNAKENKTPINIEDIISLIPDIPKNISEVLSTQPKFESNGLTLRSSGKRISLNFKDEHNKEYKLEIPENLEIYLYVYDNSILLSFTLKETITISKKIKLIFSTWVSAEIINIEIDLYKNKIFIDTSLDAADASINIEE